MLEQIYTNKFFEAVRKATTPTKPVQAQNTAPPIVGNGATMQPTNRPAPQIFTAQEAVRALSGGLNHPCQINHDAETHGVRHASILVHPEWNHNIVKEKVHTTLTQQGFKAKNAEGYKGKTYARDDTGAKVHVAHIGQHLVISSEDKKGTIPTPYTPPKEEELPTKGKKVR